MGTSSGGSCSALRDRMGPSVSNLGGTEADWSLGWSSPSALLDARLGVVALLRYDTAMQRARPVLRPRAVGSAELGTALYGLTVIAAVASSRGGYFPESWAWLASLTLWPALVILIASDRIHLGRLELAFLGLLLVYGGWVLLSAWWSVSATRTLFEAQHVLAYFGASLLTLLLVRRGTAVTLVAGVLAGVSLVSCYAFLTRVLPDRFAQFDAIAGYRLSDPIGYWNGLGIFSVMGVLLALGFAARAHSTVARGVASALPVVLVATVFFTFSRGAWVALAFGFLIALLLDPRRFQLLATGLVLAPWSALGIWLCSRSPALTTIGSSFDEASAQGRSLLLWTAVLSAASGLTGIAFAHASRTLRVPAGARRAFVIALAAAAVTGTVALWAWAGSPASIATSAWHRFQAPPKPLAGGNLANRLFDLSSTGRSALWATSSDDFLDQPIRGTGAGTFQYSWAARGTTKARDAHSLYIETLGELGVVGLLLIVGALAVPFAAAATSNGRDVLPGAVAAFGAFVIHAGVDWDWELTGVTLVALVSGLALLAAARADEPVMATSRLGVTLIPVTAVLAVFAFVSTLGNVPLGRARDALDGADYPRAISEAHDARRWAPWSAEPLRILGEAQLNSGDLAGAQASFSKALAKDPDNWELWVDLALTRTGRARREAVERAEELNPHSRQVQQLLANM
jgi:hypothetical protein